MVDLKMVRLAVLAALACGPAALAADAAGGVVASPQKLDSFAAIQHHFDLRLEESQKAIEKQRLAALEQFLPGAPEEERETVLATMVELAVGVERYDQAIAFSEKFIRNHPAGSLSGVVRKLRLTAMARNDRLAEAMKEWQAFLAEGKAERIGDVLEAGLQLAETQLNSGDIKTTRVIYETLRDKLPQAVPEGQREMVAQQLGQMISTRLDSLEQIGQAPPPIQGKDLAGNAVDLSKYRGRVVLLDFWATWCGPCISSMPHLKEVYQKYHDRGFEIVAISLDMDADRLKSFIEREKLTWRHVWDNQGVQDPQNPFGGPNTRTYNLTGIPATYLLDRDGRIARVSVPSAALEDAVVRVLARPSTQPAGAATNSGSKPVTQP